MEVTNMVVVSFRGEKYEIWVWILGVPDGAIKAPF